MIVSCTGFILMFLVGTELRCSYIACYCLQESQLLSVENSAQIFNLLSDVPGDVQDVDELLQVE